MEEEDKRLEFVRGLYNKYGQPLDPEKERKVFQHFENDFDGSLNMFYQKYNPDKIKDLTPDFLSKARDFSGFIDVVQPEEFVVDPTDPAPSSAMQSIGRTFMNAYPSIAAAFNSTLGSIDAVRTQFEQGLEERVDMLKNRGLLSESIAQGVMNMFDPHAGFEQQEADPLVANDKYFRDTKDRLQAVVDNNKALMDKMQQTYDFSDAIESGSLGQVAAASVDGLFGFLPSVIVNVATGGAGFIPMFAGDAYISGLAKKSEMTDQDIRTLLENGEDEFTIPLIAGTAAGILEKFALGKLAARFMTKAATNKGMDVIKGVLFEGGRQGFINWLEHGLMDYSESYSAAKADGLTGLDAHVEASAHSIGELFSMEGVSAGMGAAAGTMLMGGLAKGSSALSASRNKKQEAIAKEINDVETAAEAAEEVAPTEDPKLKAELDNLLGAIKAGITAEAKKEAKKEDREVKQEKEIEVASEKVDIDNRISELESILGSDAQSKKDTGEGMLNDRQEVSKELEDLRKQREELNKPEATIETSNETVAEKIAPLVLKDRKSIKTAIERAFNLNVTDATQAEAANRMTDFIDNIATKRAKKAGIGKSDWLQSRIAGLSTDQAQTGAEFMEDGRALINVASASNMGEFVNTISKVVEKDLSESERTALNEEFGIEGGAEWGEVSSNQFAESFQSYLADGKMPTKIQEKNHSPIKMAFDKVAEWVSDIKESFNKRDVSDNLKNIFDSVLEGKEIVKQEQTQVANEQITEAQVVEEVTEVESVAVEDATLSKPSQEEAGAKPADTKPTRRVKKEATVEQDIARIDDVMNTYADLQPTTKLDGTFKVTDVRKIDRGLKAIEKELNNPNATAVQKKQLAESKKKLEETRKKAEEAQKEADKKKEAISKAKTEAKEAGLSRAQVDDFVKKFPDAMILGVEDGHVSFTDASGDIKFYEVATDKVKREDTFEKEKIKKEVKRDLEAEKNKGKEQSKEKEVELTKEQKKEAKDSAAKANQAVNYMLRNNPLAQLERVLERIKAITVEGLNNSTTGIDATVEGLQENFRDYLLDIASTIEGYRDNRRVEAIKPRLEPLMEVINETPFISEKDRSDLKEKFRVIMTNYSEVIEVKQRAAEKVDERALEKEKKGTLADGKTSVQNIGGDQAHVSFLNRLMSAFELGDKKVLFMDIAFLARNSKENSKLTEEQYREKVDPHIRRVILAQEVYDLGEINPSEILDVINEYHEEGLEGFHSKTGDVHVIGINRDIGADYFHAKTVAHEFGHMVKKELYDNAPQYVKDAILADYGNWKDVQAKKAGRKATTVKNYLKTNMTGASQELFMELHAPKNRTLNKKDLEMLADWNTFDEYFAEQTAQFISEYERTGGLFSEKGPVALFFQNIVKALANIAKKLGSEYGVSQSMADFLNEHMAKDKDRIKENNKVARERAKHEAGKTKQRIAGLKVKILGLENNIANPSVPTLARVTDKKELETRAKKIAAIIKKKLKEDKAELEKAKEQLAKEEANIPDLFSIYQAKGGKNDLAWFEKATQTVADKLVEEAFEKDIKRASFGGASSSDNIIGDEGLPDMWGEVNYSKTDRSKNGHDWYRPEKRNVLFERVAEFVNGKFNTREELENLVKQVNSRLTEEGIPKITKKEMANEILARTDKGDFIDVVTDIYKEHDARPRKELTEVLKSINAPIEDRIEALGEAERIMRQESLNPEESLRAARLYMVGLANADLAEIKYVKESGIAKMIAKDNLDKVRLDVLKERNLKSVEADTAFYDSFFTAKKNADGSYTYRESGKSMTFKIFDARKEFKKGELVAHLGNLYRLNADSSAGDFYSRDKMDFERSIVTKETKAQRDLKGVINRMRDTIRDFALESYGLEALVSRLASTAKGEGLFESAANKLLGEEGFRAAQVDRDRQVIATKDKINEIGKKVFNVATDKEVAEKIKEARTKAVTIEFLDNEGVKVSKPMYISEAMTMYAYLRQPDLQKRFEHMKNQKVNAEDERFWSDAKRDAIVDAIPAEYKTFVEATTSELMPTVYDRVNQAYKRINGYDLIQVENYFPVSTYVADSGKASVLDADIKDFASLVASVSNKSLKERQANRSPLKPTDFFQTLSRYNHGAHHYANYVLPMRRASAMLQQGPNREYLNKAFGHKIMANIDWNLDNLAAGGTVHFQRDANVEFLRKLAISGAFMGNVTMIPKQLSSFLAYGAWMPGNEYLGYYTKLGTNPTQVIADTRAILNMASIQRRLAEGTGANADTLNTMLSNYENEINKSAGRQTVEYYHGIMTDLLFKPTQWGDIGAIVAGGLPYYNHVLKQGMEKYGNKAEAERYAEIKFIEATSRTQQSRDMLDTGKWQTMSSTASLFTTFMSTPMLYGRIMSNSVRDMVNGKDKRVRLNGLKNFVLFGYVLPSMFQIASSMSFSYFAEDEEEEEGIMNGPIGKSLAIISLSQVQHIPIVYPFMQNIVDKEILGRDFDMNLAAPLAIAEDAYPALKRLGERYKEDGELDWDDESVHKDISKVAKSLGIGYGQMRNFTKSWANFDESINEDWRLLLGYSKGALGIEED
jgi:hypothetical protein